MVGKCGAKNVRCETAMAGALCMAGAVPCGLPQSQVASVGFNEKAAPAKGRQ
jgi:hypothetical protein